MTTNRKRTRLIVFSGLDSAGKSTQIDLLITELNQKGEDPVYLWTRGGYTPTFSYIKKLLRSLPWNNLPQSGKSIERDKMLTKGYIRSIWLILAVVDLIWVYGVQIRWWLLLDKIIVCDRYIWDTEIDFKLNFGITNFNTWWLWKILSFVKPQPDRAFLLTIPIDESLRRSQLKNEPFPNTEDELCSRFKEYKIIAQSQHFLVIDGLQSVEQIQYDIRNAIEN